MAAAERNILREAALEEATGVRVEEHGDDRGLSVCWVALWLLAPLLAACSREHELRGKSVPSPDGRTLLVVAESPGCAELRVDGKAWPHALGAPGSVPPGVRQIACADGSNEIGFEIKPGTTFHFDYWGP